MWPMKRHDKATRNRAPTAPSSLSPTAPAERGGHRAGMARNAAPQPPRGTAEARATVTLARLLLGTITPRRADTVLALVEPHRPRLMPKPLNTLAAMTGQPSNRMREALLRLVGPIVMDVLLPRCRDHLIDRLVGGRGVLAEDGLPNAVEVAQAMHTLVTMLRGGGRGTLVAVAQAMESDARADADRSVRQAAEPGTDGEGMTLDALADTLLRFEARRLVLETLGSSSALQEVAFQSRRLARLALRRATAAIEGFVADRGLKALYGSLTTLASVDALVVIVLRNLDDQMECREESGPFVEPADRKALGDYLSAAWRLSDTLFDLVGKAANGGGLDDLLFEAMLRQLRGLHHVCADIDHAERPPALDTLEKRLVERSQTLARQAGDTLIATMLRRPGNPAAARRLFARCRSLTQLLYDMGREQELEELALHLVVARDALESTPR